MCMILGMACLSRQLVTSWMDWSANDQDPRPPSYSLQALCPSSPAPNVSSQAEQISLHPDSQPSFTSQASVLSLRLLLFTFQPEHHHPRAHVYCFFSSKINVGSLIMSHLITVLQSWISFTVVTLFRSSSWELHINDIYSIFGPHWLHLIYIILSHHGLCWLRHHCLLGTPHKWYI